MPLTLPEELTLLMLDDESGRLMDPAMPAGDFALAAAVLAELALLSRIDGDAASLRVVDPKPTGEAVLDAALARMAAAPAANSRHWIETLAAEAGATRAAVFDRLVGRGILRVEESRFLWVFPERRYPMVSGKEEREVKARLLGVLFKDEIPDPRDALLIGLASAADLLSLILTSDELDRAQPRIDAVTRLEELSRSLSAAVGDILTVMARYAYPA